MAGILDLKRISRLLDRIEKHYDAAISETAYQYSYEPGSTRYYQANARAHKAEAAATKALAELRDYLGRSAGTSISEALRAEGYHGLADQFSAPPAPSPSSDRGGS